jgi:hypothetical protein
VFLPAFWRAASSWRTSSGLDTTLPPSRADRRLDQIKGARPSPVLVDGGRDDHCWASEGAGCATVRNRSTMQGKRRSSWITASRA